LHALAKAMHRFAAAFVRLKSTFHYLNILSIIQWFQLHNGSPYPAARERRAKVAQRR
jgi:hypothetical protein